MRNVLHSPIETTRNTGKRCADLEDEVGLIAAAVCDALEHFDFVVDAFQQTGVQRIGAVTDHAVDALGEGRGRTSSAARGDSPWRGGHWRQNRRAAAG